MKTHLAGAAPAPILMACATSGSMSGPAAARDAPSARLITKTDTNPFFVKRREGDQARQAGLLVIALDTPPTPAGAADATFAWG